MENSVEDKNVTCKKRNVPLKILKILLVCLLAFLIVISGWICFSSFDKASPLKFIPDNYTAVVHSDCIYRTVEPLVELNAADTFLADPAFSQARNGLMQARDFINSSPFFLKKALYRRIDIGLYDMQNADFIAVADLGPLSAATRLAFFAGNFLRIKGLSCIRSTASYFEFATPEGAVFYAKPYKNLVIASGTKDLFLESVEKFNEHEADEKLTAVLESRKSDNLRIVYPAQKIIDDILVPNSGLAKFSPYLKKDFPVCAEFFISNDGIDIKMTVPVETSDGTPVASILGRNSDHSKILSFLTSDTQYYTILNLNSFELLKDTAVQLLDEKMKVDSLWDKGNGFCKMVLGVSLNDMLFSWTGGECVAFGIEGSSDPVFAIEIINEDERQKVFKKISGSLLINTNSSLIVNGMRLPCFELPKVLDVILGVFGINMPDPYYMVQNNFIFFSASPQNLNTIYNHMQDGHVIGRNQNWKKVSDKSDSSSTMEIYYNLNRTLPFFLENNSEIAKILKHYKLGKCRFEIAGGNLNIFLKAANISGETSLTVPGFPLKTEKVNDYRLLADNTDKPENVYWIENDRIVKSINLNSLTQKSFDAGATCYLSVSGKDVWAVTSMGTVFLLDHQTLECREEFPVETGASVCCAGAVSGKEILIPAIDGRIIAVQKNGTTSTIEIGEDMNLRSSPTVLGDMAAVYNRGFEGEIYLLKNGKCLNQNNPLIVDGIGFGSPCLAEISGKIYTAFITQSGTFYLFCEGKLVEGYPLETSDIFYTNAVYKNKAFYALSQDAKLYKIPLEGNFLFVKLPGVDSAKEGSLSVYSSKDFNAIFVNGDTNKIFAFTPSLELITPFPLAGYGKPVIADINNDKKKDCLVLSATREINGWTVK